MINLLNFIKAHPNDWESILSQPPYCLKISRDNPYIMFKYSQTESDFSLPEVKEARGIIFREDTWQPVCVPFYKFMNAEESNSDLYKINWDCATVQEKIDGSLIKVWFDKNWHISTNGSINAYTTPLNSIKYKTFGELFEAALPISIDSFTNSLDTTYTYMFELVSPYNRVVIPYDNTELYYLGARNNTTLQETLPEQTELSFYNWFKIPQRYNLTSYEAVRIIADKLPWDEEGYVVCDDEFNRVKVKSLKYLEAHYVRNNNIVTNKRLLDIIRQGEQEEFLIYANDYKNELKSIETAYNQACSDLAVIFNSLHTVSYDTRKDYALKVLEQPKWMQSFLFNNKDLTTTINNTKTERWIEILEQEGYIK